jgi:hypothetical protein
MYETGKIWGARSPGRIKKTVRNSLVMTEKVNHELSTAVTPSEAGIGYLPMRYHYSIRLGDV